jgi:hypothetical protein
MQNATTSCASGHASESSGQSKDQGCEWKCIGHMGIGDIIWAPLKHPHHKDVHMRYYLIVSKDMCDTAKGYLYETLAVVSLETNSKRSRDAYYETEQRFLKDIKLAGEGTSANDLEIRGWMPYENKWKLLPKTTVDLSTVLIIRSHVGSGLTWWLFCRDVGNLTTASAEKVDAFYKELMNNWSYMQYMTGKTRKVPYTSTERPASKGPPLPDNSSEATVTIFDPQRDVHVRISDVKMQTEARKLDAIVGRDGFSKDLEKIQDPKQRHKIYIQALVAARKDKGSDSDLEPI